eukprot:TRINITY_DN8833_c0_g1_i3.p1 TRINITY_DN8833_c0_g1~~TRINITY_DN8833_c0_g1_i3.p1  ORF type:complete len:308 (+),score=23.23 TRINITY_DN8833_c0_g1_i3:111-1034(+)
MSASQRLKVSVVQTQPPQPRAFCSACVSEFQTIFVFGGRVAGEAILSELIVFDPATVSWSTPATAGTAPKREHHAACFVGSKMIVVGGWDGNKRQNDVWMLDTLSTPFTWSKVEVGGRLAGHSGHSLTYLPSRDEIVVVGRESGQRRYSDTHALSVKRLGNGASWKLEGSKVKSRSGHSATLHGDHILAWGGRRSSCMDRINTRTLTSGNLSFEANAAPVGRSFHGACLLPDAAALVVAGGLIDAVKSLGDVHLFDLKTGRWSQPEIEGSLPPIHAHVMCRAGETIYIFGGYCSGKLSNRMFAISLV